MFVVALSYLAFFSIALPDSMLGVVWPSMRLSFGQPTSAAGLVPPFGVAAGLISSTLTGYVVRRLGVGRLLFAGTAVSAAGVGISAVSATFWQFLVSVVVLGLSAGVVDTALNAYAARQFGPRRINLMHASYGVGAALSPLLVTAVLASGASWRWSYVIVGSLQLALALVFGATRRRWSSAPKPDEVERDARQAAHRSPRRALTLDAGLGLLAVVVQTGIESAVALWAYTFLVDGVRVDRVLAGTLASGFWVMLIIGRVTLGSLAERVGSWTVMGVAMAGLLGAAVMTNAGIGLLATIGVLLFGFATAPIYPLLVLTTPERTSAAAADRIVGFQAGASSLGAAVLPLLVGLAMGASALAFAPAMAALCVLAAAVHVILRVRRARTVRARRSSGAG